MDELAPICLFVYNRPQHTALTLEHLKKNKEAKDTKLIIFADGPNPLRPEHHADIQTVRELIRKVDGFKEVQIIERGQNFGLAKSIITGVTDTLEKYGRVIVVEDDLLTSPYFLKFLNDGLRIYENEKKVFHIQGYNYPVKGGLPEAFFTRDPGSWGWATWKDRWTLFEPSSAKLLSTLKDRYAFDFDGSYPFVKMLKDQAAGKVNSWAIRWYASGFTHNKLALWPGKSLVANIGFDQSGVHCGETTAYDGELSLDPVTDFPSEIVENPVARAAIIEFFKGIRVSFKKRVIGRLTRLFSKIFKESVWAKGQRGASNS